ncbi:hypothetical protein ACSNOB_04535 [Micromonospora sp. URMC 106]|uniref:hypothetical protein n=1 Tax=Micromonospora sp. URMC 106 TaxID=3423408 RepID=UPI003F1CAB51
MPASTRHHRALAVFVHCLGILAAVPALPTAAPPAAAAQPPPAAAAPTPAPAMPSAPPAVPTPTRAAPPVAKPPVTVAVAPESTPAPRYRIEVRNAGSSPVDTTVRQELPPGASATAITAGGRASRAAGSATEVTWQLKLPARSTTTLGTALTTAAPHRPLTAPACAFARDGSRPYDCATATWNAAAPAAAQETAGTPAWRHTPVLLAGLATVAVLAVGGVWTWRRRRRPVAAALSPGGRGTVYPRPATPRPAQARRTPSVWLIVPVAATVLAGTVGTAAWTATREVAAIDTDSQPTSGAWIGRGANGAIGEPLRESAFEFTVYRIACEPGRSARQCQATVGVRNLTPEQQSWHGRLQRAYLPDGNFVTTDEQATRAANQGRDVFAQPMAAGSRAVLPLVFTVDGQAPPEQLELRSGVFSAGVRVDVP